MRSGIVPRIRSRADVPKRGYRFLAPVETGADRWTGHRVPPSTPSAKALWANIVEPAG
jgi:hypothetical protein